jgi:hypothetical protein
LPAHIWRSARIVRRKDDVASVNLFDDHHSLYGAAATFNAASTSRGRFGLFAGPKKMAERCVAPPRR